MKKLMSVMLSLMLLGSVAASAETMEGEVVSPLIGRITEVREDGSYLIDTLEGSQVHVLVQEDTDVEAVWTLGEGDVISVLYDGTMTRSLPPQVSALGIQCHSVEGTVTEVNAADNRVLLNSPEAGAMWVTLPEGAKAEDFAGQAIRVYFNGVMALSYPAQIFAYTIDPVVALSGKVTEVDAEYLMLESDEGVFRVNFDEKSKIVGELATEDAVVIYYSGISTRSMPPQIFGSVIIKTDTVG